MKVFVQTNQNGMPYSINGYAAMTGFEKMGFEVVLFKNLSDVLDKMKREDVVVGGLGTVRHRLSGLGIDYQEINYPQEIRQYLCRRIWHSKMDTINSHPEMWPVFVKSVTGSKLPAKSSARQEI